MAIYLNIIVGPWEVPRLTRLLMSASLAAPFMASLGGCAIMPASGPTSSQIRAEASVHAQEVNFKIVEIADLASVPSAPDLPEAFLPEHFIPPTDLIAPGDLLEVSVYESGVALFGGSRSGAAIATGGVNTTSQVERLPPLRVDDFGAVRLPYIGRIEVAGLTATQLESKIRNGYKGMSQNPQVLVAIKESVGNSVIVSGEIARPGRLVLPTNTETLSDVIALSGGYKGDAKDLSIRIVRLGQTVELRLSDVMSDRARDMRIFPADRVAVVRAPRTIAVMGAAGKVEQMIFSGPTISLAEALAQAGGSNPSSGNAAAVFVFRFQKNPDGTETPVAYHVNMMRASGYFVSQRFVMFDKDVLYVANADANQPSKVVSLVSQLFGPLAILRSVVN